MASRSAVSTLSVEKKRPDWVAPVWLHRACLTAGLAARDTRLVNTSIEVVTVKERPVRTAVRARFVHRFFTPNPFLHDVGLSPC
jgi:hypothetical protein